MNKNIVGVLIGVLVVVAVVLAISCYTADVKAKQLNTQITVLNDLIKEKDIVINKLIVEKDSKQQELDTLMKELETVKTDLSNTVLKLQAQVPALPPMPVKIPVKK